MSGGNGEKDLTDILRQAGGPQYLSPTATAQVFLLQAMLRGERQKKEKKVDMSERDQAAKELSLYTSRLNGGSFEENRQARKDQHVRDNYAISERRGDAMESWIAAVISQPEMSREQRLAGLELVEGRNPSQAVRLAVERICPPEIGIER